MAAYTQGPWHWTWDGDGQPGRIGVTLPCEPVEQCGYLSHCIALTQPGKFDARANAERIVQCVNAHDALVEALRDFMLAASPGCKAAQWRALAAQAARKGRAALAKLEDAS